MTLRTACLISLQTGGSFIYLSIGSLFQYGKGRELLEFREHIRPTHRVGRDIRDRKLNGIIHRLCLSIPAHDIRRIHFCGIFYPTPDPRRLQVNLLHMHGLDHLL